VAAAAAAAVGEQCAGLVLVDGGFERPEVTSGVDVDEFLRGLDEPPEVLRSMAAYLGDRRGFDPATWDADQERAALDAVVETAAGHVVRAVRPFVVEALVRTMFGLIRSRSWGPSRLRWPSWWRQARVTPMHAWVSCAGAPRRGRPPATRQSVSRRSPTRTT
jgi:hypothetical protein